MNLSKVIRSRFLYNVPVFSFGKRTRNNALNNIDQATEKIRLKESVADVKKLQSLLHETSVNKTLGTKINHTAKYDEEFKEFLNQYKAKNRQFANIIDLSQYSKDNNISNKNPEMR